MASMAGVYNMLNTEEAISTTRKWNEKIGAFALPVITHIGTSNAEGGWKEHLRDAFKDMGTLSDVQHTGDQQAGFAGAGMAHVLIGSYSSIVKCKLPCNSTDDQKKSSTMAWIFVNELKGTFVVPGAFDVQIVGALVLVWPQQGARLPSIRYGDVNRK